MGWQRGMTMLWVLAYQQQLWPCSQQPLKCQLLFSRLQCMVTWLNDHKNLWGVNWGNHYCVSTCCSTLRQGVLLSLCNTIIGRSRGWWPARQVLLLAEDRSLGKRAVWDFISNSDRALRLITRIQVGYQGHQHSISWDWGGDGEVRELRKIKDAWKTPCGLWDAGNTAPICIWHHVLVVEGTEHAGPKLCRGKEEFRMSLCY